MSDDDDDDRCYGDIAIMITMVETMMMMMINTGCYRVLAVVMNDITNDITIVLHCEDGSFTRVVDDIMGGIVMLVINK